MATGNTTDQPWHYELWPPAQVCGAQAQARFVPCGLEVAAEDRSMQQDFSDLGRTCTSEKVALATFAGLFQPVPAAQNGYFDVCGCRVLLLVS